MFWKKGMLFTTIFALLVFMGQTPADSNANDKLIETNVITLNTNNDNTNPSPDFDGDGTVGIPDFLLFVDQFGLSQGDEGYEARFDLDGDDTIGIGDFLIFVDAFGTEVPSPVITIPDANLRSEIVAALGKVIGEPITRKEMASLRRLEAWNSDIRDLTGLEFATGLTYLRLRPDRGTNRYTRTDISNLSPLSGLINLTWLYLTNHNITDVSPLSGLTNLRTLELTNNNITDVSALSGLTNLTRLSLSNNNITDVSALSGLTNLTSLNLTYNNITDVSALSGLTNLTSLNLTYNNITDLAPLVANRGLGAGDVVLMEANPLSTTSIAVHISALQTRGVSVSFDDTIVFTDPRIYNDNVFVLPVTEDLAAGKLPLEKYATRFYEYFSDAFDFLIFLPCLEAGQLDSGAFKGAFHRGVRNDIQGIGRSFYFRDSAGSAGKLQSMIFFASGHPRLGLNYSVLVQPVMLHELMHRWANFIVGPKIPHWDFTSANGSLGGFDITTLVDHGGGRYSASRQYSGYSPIELYLAGLIPPEEVPDLWVAEDGDYIRDKGGTIARAENGDLMFTASRVKTYTIEDIIAEHGPRVPDHTQSQKAFRAAVILLVSEEYPATHKVLEVLSNDASWFSYAGEDDLFDRFLNFYEATGGRATITLGGLSQFKSSRAAKRPAPRSFGTPPPPIVDRWK